MMLTRQWACEILDIYHKVNDERLRKRILVIISQKIRRVIQQLFPLWTGDLFDMLLPMLNIYQEYVRNHHYSLQVNNTVIYLAVCADISLLGGNFQMDDHKISAQTLGHHLCYYSIWYFLAILICWHCHPPF